MSDISLKGLFGMLCVLAAIAIGIVGLIVAGLVAAVRVSGGQLRLSAALERTIAGPATCTAIGLLALAWTATASNDTIDAAGPYLALASVIGGVATGLAISRRLRRG